MSALLERRRAPEEDERAAWRRRVAHAFSRAAGDYRHLATAQQTMGETLWARLPARADVVLDLGCGPGHWSARLATRYGDDARVLGLDLAPGMLSEARRTHGEPVRWLCADAAALPLADASLDLVFSNLAIQWCPSLEDTLAELARVLRPGGRALDGGHHRRQVGVVETPCPGVDGDLAEAG